MDYLVDIYGVRSSRLTFQIDDGHGQGWDPRVCELCRWTRRMLVHPHYP